MPMPSVDEFWNLLAYSRLVDAGAVAALRAAGPTADVKATAEWLVDRGVITGWQAKRLVSGDRGPFFLGDYRLLERRERQRDGLLFAARHDPSGRAVTLMLLNAKLCKELDIWTAVVRRTTAAHQATHPMLSRTWALEQAEGSRFIVCEAVAGVPLADELARLGPLPPPQAAVLAFQVARAVAELHAAGAVHGGLSLDVLLREPAAAGAPERDGPVRLLQFPLVGDPHALQPRAAGATDEEVAALGRRASFIAPELLLPDQPCDPRSDVYAIGCILHALLAGTPPCWRGDPQATLRHAAFAGPEPLEPPVPPEFASLVRSLTARDPDARYQSAGEAAEAIAACCGSDLPLPAAAAPEPAPGFAPEAAFGMEHGVASSAADAGFTWQPPEPQTTAEHSAAAPARHPTGSAATRAARRRAARLRLIGGGIAALVVTAVAGLVVSQVDFGERSGKPRSVSRRGADRPTRTAGDRGRSPDDSSVGHSKTSGESPSPAAATRGADPEPVAVERQVVVDDPTLPWASPTSGLAPRLAFLPPGSQLVLLARPAAVLGDEEGRLFYKSLGPAAETAAKKLAAWCGCEFGDIETLQIGWQSGAAGDVQDGYVLRVVESRRIPDDDAARVAAWGPTDPIEVGGQTIHKGQRLCFWVPASEQGRTLVVAPADSLAEIVAAAPAAPADGLAVSLPKDMETLVGMLDADRHVTLFGSPHYLVHDGRRLLAGPLARLADPLAAFFGDAIRAVALSLHFGDSGYAELDAVATADVPASRRAADLKAAVVDAPNAVEEYCVALEPAAYGRKLVMRLPQMIRMLGANLRAGAEGRGAVVNAYLPRHAPHNLALATELALAQSPGRAGSARPADSAGPAAPQDALGKLQKKITLTFVKDNLERSIQIIAEEAGVPMEILGGDLQLEGITKNQSFGLDERDKTAEAVLRVILAKANPDGKLVFVVRKKDGGETIEITTRAAAEKRGDKLPAGQ